ncbi:hypothetical protein CDAR_441721 [Caerostris darwini]|uniref:Uncharacterized protein n=1 Tax=Caerostris darwini TaxID=1538125 RepID=A0AAV4UPC8_9ARAC|nr:hypothetical protein CDAR_441721 [Caerostris darwini]
MIKAFSNAVSRISMLLCELFEIPLMQAILHPHLCRNETILQHTISLHFIPEKQYAFSAKNTLPFQYQSYSSFAQSLDSRRCSILGHGILIRLETRNRTTELPRRTCMSGRLSGTRFVAKWKSDVFFCECPG